jgi:ATP-dependent DNA helicase RecG
LDFCRIPRQIHEIREKFNYTNRTKFRQSYMTPLLDAGLLEMTIPDKPTSSQQKYQTTAKGLQYLTQSIDSEDK